MSEREIVLEPDVPFAPARQLTSGNIELLYEEGRVRYFKYKGREVLRMIYPALRDENWRTIKGEMQDEKIALDPEGFTITYKLVYPIGYKAEFEITGRNNNISYIMRGEALADFKSKRIGLCVHHPILPCAGREVNIIHDNGKKATYRFPELIRADWPFTDIISMQWTTSNAEAKLDFEGDIFETEDQRNWTDDSYKTYSGPQYKTPMLDIRKGSKMMHKVTLSVTDSSITSDREIGKPLRSRFPEIGYARGTNPQQLTVKEIELAKQLPFHHYRVDLDLSNDLWKSVFRDAVNEAKQLNTKLELAVLFNAIEQADDFIQEIKGINEIDSLLILSEKNYKEMHAKISEAFPGLKIGFGSNGWFADINGALPMDAPYDFVSFRVSPQVHQDDNRSILENLGSQHTTIETLKQKTGNKGVHVSPVVFNHNKEDERLHTSFAAWWTINAICNFAAAGYITLFELKGPRGIIHDENRPSALYHLLKTFGDFKPEYIARPKKDEIIIENKTGDQIIFHKKVIHE